MFLSKIIGIDQFAVMRLYRPMHSKDIIAKEFCSESGLSCAIVIGINDRFAAVSSQLNDGISVINACFVINLLHLAVTYHIAP